MRNQPRPIPDCKIILRWTYRNHLNQYYNHEVDFFHISAFTNYLRWEPERAMAIGYSKKIDQEVLHNSRSQNVRLFLKNVDKEFGFENVYTFAAFLKANKDIAQKVHFIPKTT